LDMCKTFLGEGERELVKSNFLVGWEQPGRNGEGVKSYKKVDVSRRQYSTKGE